MGSLPSGNHLALGHFYRQRACLSKAYYHYCEALAQTPHLPEIHYRLAVILHDWQEWDLAEGHYQAAIAARPSRSLYFRWGLLNHQRGRLGLAAACYEQAIAADPDYLNAYLNLGSVIKQQDPPRAVAFYQALLERFPARARLRHNLGNALAEQQDFAGALAQYKSALRLDPELSKAHQGLGRLWLRQGDGNKAIKYYGDAVRLAPSPQVCGHLVTVLLGQGRVKEIWAPLAQAIAQLSEFCQAYGQNALAHASNSRLSQTRQTCAQLLQMLQLPQSRETAAAAEALLFQIYCHGGAIALESENFRRAEQLYHQAIALRPELPGLYQQLAHCLRQQGRGIAAAAIEPGGSARLPESGPGQAQAAPPSNAQCGVTCQTCMGELVRSFCPEQLARGVFRIGFNCAPRFAPLATGVRTLPGGTAWVTPRRSAWAACHGVVVSTAAGAVLPDLSRAYPWRLPNCPGIEAASNSPELSSPELSSPGSRSPALQQPDRPEKQQLSGKVALLSTLSGHVYYHWMIDLLPRLGLLEQQGMTWDQIDWFVVNSLEQSFQRETLRQLGIPLEKVLESDRLPHIQAEQLIAPSFPGHLDWIPPETIAFLRSHFLPNGDRGGRSGQSQSGQSRAGQPQTHLHQPPPSGIPQSPE